MSDWVMMTKGADPALRTYGMTARMELSGAGKLGLLTLTVALHLVLLHGWAGHRPVALSALASAPLSVSMMIAATPQRESHPHPVQPRESSFKAHEVTKPQTTRRAEPKPLLRRHVDPHPAALTVKRAVKTAVATTPATKTAAVASTPHSVTPAALPTQEPRSAMTAQPHTPGASAPETRRREARFDAAYLHNPRPAYPPFSLRLREEGRVVLRVLVSRVGSAQRVLIARSSGYPRLDRSAQETVKGWRFVPAQRGDEATDAWVLVPINFSLRGEA